MNQKSATYRDGQVVLDEPVEWPDGTKLEVIPTAGSNSRVKPGTSIRDSKPLELGGTLRPLDKKDDLLEEMLNASGD